MSEHSLFDMDSSKGDRVGRPLIRDRKLTEKGRDSSDKTLTKNLEKL